MIETALIASALILYLYGKGTNILQPTTDHPVNIPNPLAGGAFSSFATAETTPLNSPVTSDSGNVFASGSPVAPVLSIPRPSPIVKQAHPVSPAPVTSRAPGRIGASHLMFGTGSSAAGQASSFGRRK